jgi:hypothetical protein
MQFYRVFKKLLTEFAGKSWAQQPVAASLRSAFEASQMALSAGRLKNQCQSLVKIKGHLGE